jgi:predicted ATP-dependent endonuclease of OLD family
MELSERSNGLKWYLNFFIEMQGNQLPNQNVVYLLDEPGMSLHINAQKELLNLFNHIAGNNNQVIYTAHSPYMIDTNKIQCIRAIEKDELGFTHIYKTAYDSKLSSASKEDTLSPIINALGMNLCSTFGPAKDKLNVVTEGISDYIYITTMAIYLNVSLDKYALIASMGATNCINICTILCGWGCPYVALFDFDNEGVEKGAEVFRKDFYLKLGKEYLFIADVTQEDINQKKYKRNPIMIEDIVTVDELDQFRVERSIASDLSKPLLAKIYSNCVKEGTWKPSEKCVMNFKQLFSKLDMIYY